MNYDKLNKCELILEIKRLSLDLPTDGSGKNGGIIKDDLIGVLKEGILKPRALDIDYLSNTSVDMARIILYKVSPEDIINTCNVNDHFKTKVCTLFFWDKYITKKLGNDLNDKFKNASKNGETETVKILLKYGKIDPSIDNNYAIRWASINGHYEIVELLLNCFIIDKQSITAIMVDPSANNNAAIRWASNNGHYNIVKLLLALPKERGINPSAHSNFAIKRALIYGHLDIVKILTEDKRYNNDNNDKYIIKAFSSNKLKILDYLLKKSNINSVLSVVASNKKYKLVKYILDKYLSNNKALKIATKRVNIHLLQFLIKNDRMPDDYDILQNMVYLAEKNVYPRGIYWNKGYKYKKLIKAYDKLQDLVDEDYYVNEEDYNDEDYDEEDVFHQVDDMIDDMIDEEIEML